MTKKLIVAIAVSAIACTAWVSTASAKHKHQMAPAPAAQQATALPGVNPMTNAPSSQPVQNPAPFKHVPGANPM